MPNRTSVGRIVHFYSDAVANRDPACPTYGFNGQGAGPYAALVIQAFDGPYANLKVMPYGEPFDEGSVSHFDDAHKDADGHVSRYWIEPPRV